jgi:transaldolase
MQNDHEEVSVKLTEEQAHASNAEKIHMDENAFRFLLNEDPMATEKLAEGIRRFAADVRKLEDLLSEKLST